MADNTKDAMQLHPLALAAAALAGALALTAHAAGASSRAADGFPILAVSQASAIPSTADDALLPPASWNCERIFPEYRAWLDEGNAPSDWKHVGKTYRDAANEELYAWQDWLDWAATAGCGEGLVQGESVLLLLPSTATIVGGSVSALGAPLLASELGSGNDSPG